MTKNNGKGKIKYKPPRSTWKIYFELIVLIIVFPYALYKFLRWSKLSINGAKEIAGILWMFAGLMIAFFGLSFHSTLGFIVFTFGLFVVCPLGAIHHFKRGYRCEAEDC